MTEIIDGREIANQLLAKAKKKIDESGLKIDIAVILVGDNPASLSYISQKEKSCSLAGVGFSLHKFSSEISEEALKRELSLIAETSTGLIVQLPLPKEMKTQAVLDTVPMEKDIDILTTGMAGRYYSGDFSLLPPTAGAIAYLLKDVDLIGKDVVVVGAGRLVGRPVAHWLISQKATVSILNSSTRDISSYTSRADIVISGVGQGGVIRGEMIKKGAIVIDAGSSSEIGAVRGDVEGVIGKASKVSPVPGGVGPITTACLIENAIKLKELYG